MFIFTRSRIWPLRAGLALAFVLSGLSLSALETDNFYLPPDAEFADLGGFLEALHTRAIEAGVREVNSRIERALNLKDRAARESALEQCHTPDAVVEAVAARFGDAPWEKGRIEGVLGSSWARKTYPNLTISHYDISMNLRGRILIDPRALMMLLQCSTMKAYGVYFGTDKLVHFHQLGQQYYRRYRALLAKGLSPEEARAGMIEHFANGTVLAEGRGFGTILTGVYSNADMAANYLGFKFFLNLTEPVTLQRRELEPLVVRCGVFWRVNDQVRPHSGWFRPFLSDHLNEALNPNLYDPTMRPFIQKILEKRAARIVEFYTVRDGRPRDSEYFENLERELSTYYGEPYGHSGHFDRLMNIGNTCLPALQNRVDSEAPPPASTP